MSFGFYDAGYDAAAAAAAEAARQAAEEARRAAEEAARIAAAKAEAERQAAEEAKRQAEAQARAEAAAIAQQEAQAAQEAELAQAAEAEAVTQMEAAPEEVALDGQSEMPEEASSQKSDDILVVNDVTSQEVGSNAPLAVFSPIKAVSSITSLFTGAQDAGGSNETDANNFAFSGQLNEAQQGEALPSKVELGSLSDDVMALAPAIEAKKTAWSEGAGKHVAAAARLSRTGDDVAAVKELQLARVEMKSDLSDSIDADVSANYAAIASGIADRAQQNGASPELIAVVKDAELIHGKGMIANTHQQIAEGLQAEKGVETNLYEKTTNLAGNIVRSVGAHLGEANQAGHTALKDAGAIVSTTVGSAFDAVSGKKGVGEAIKDSAVSVKDAVVSQANFGKSILDLGRPIQFEGNAADPMRKAKSEAVEAYAQGIEQYEAGDLSLDDLNVLQRRASSVTSNFAQSSIDLAKDKAGINTESAKTVAKTSAMAAGAVGAGVGAAAAGGVAVTKGAIGYGLTASASNTLITQGAQEGARMSIDAFDGSASQLERGNLQLAADLLGTFTDGAKGTGTFVASFNLALSGLAAQAAAQNAGGGIAGLKAGANLLLGNAKSAAEKAITVGGILASTNSTEAFGSMIEETDDIIVRGEPDNYEARQYLSSDKVEAIKNGDYDDRLKIVSKNVDGSVDVIYRNITLANGTIVEGQEVTIFDEGNVIDRLRSIKPNAHFEGLHDFNVTFENDKGSLWVGTDRVDAEEAAHGKESAINKTRLALNINPITGVVENKNSQRLERKAEGSQTTGVKSSNYGNEFRPLAANPLSVDQDISLNREEFDITSTINDSLWVGREELASVISNKGAKLNYSNGGVNREFGLWGDINGNFGGLLGGILSSSVNAQTVPDNLGATKPIIEQDNSSFISDALNDADESKMQIFGLLDLVGLKKKVETMSIGTSGVTTDYTALAPNLNPFAQVGVTLSQKMFNKDIVGSLPDEMSAEELGEAVEFAKSVASNAIDSGMQLAQEAADAVTAFVNPDQRDNNTETLQDVITGDDIAQTEGGFQNFFIDANVGGILVSQVGGILVSQVETQSDNKS